MVATAMSAVVVGDERFGAARPSLLPAPQVSVIIATRNAAATLSYSLASLARQTMPAWEAIVVDDGSEDGTAALAHRYAAHDARVRVARQYTRGASVARNRGVREAATEWLLFLDPGDELEPRALEQLLDAATRNPSVSVIHGGWAQLTRDGMRVDEGAPRADGDLFDLLAREPAFPVHSCMVRRVLVEAAGGWDATLSFGEDWDLWQRVARMGVRFNATHARVALTRSPSRHGEAAATPNRILEDGVRVLRRGHAPDPRVCSPSPRHVDGRGDDPTPNLYHFACWCAGRLLANGDDARATLDALDDAPRYVELDPAAVADAVLRGARAAAPELAARPAELRRRISEGIGSYLEELQRRSGAPRLAAAARAALEVRLTAAERLSRRIAIS